METRAGRIAQQGSRMHFPTHEQKQALLEPVLRLAEQRLTDAAAAEARAFIAHYYDHVDAEDLASRAPGSTRQRRPRCAHSWIGPRATISPSSAIASTRSNR